MRAKGFACRQSQGGRIMVVQHNLRAMNSDRMLGITTSAQSKSTEKLSSGYKINRAADDAAGLSISEKMRKQIRGLTQASANAQDGISTVQTAEGALTEVHDMLQRMNELAVKADNGTMSQSDRQNVQDEMNQLVKEIDRVSETTKFNETYLLKGGTGTNSNGATIADGGLVGTLNGIKLSANGAAAALTTGDTIKLGTIGLKQIGDALATVADNVVTGANAAAGNIASITSKDTQTNILVTLKDGTTKSYKTSAEFKTDYGFDIAADGSATYDIGLKDDPANNYAVDTTDAILSGYTIGDVLNAKAYVNGDGSVSLYDATAPHDPLVLNLHVGADSTANNKISLKIDSMDATTLGVRDAKGNAISVMGEKESGIAIDTIANAISKVSSQRSSLGAIQNRLEHTINNLDNVVENTTSAESAIRDTDMAKEMVKYSNNNILSQAGQAMLAQSNQANQGVLSLLQ